MPRAGIALGSNLGDRQAHLQAARDCLREIAIPGEPFLQASTYQTEPLLCPPGSPYFHNSVVEIAFDGDAFELLELTQWKTDDQLAGLKSDSKFQQELKDECADVFL